MKNREISSIRNSTATCYWAADVVGILVGTAILDVGDLARIGRLVHTLFELISAVSSYFT